MSTFADDRAAVAATLTTAGVEAVSLDRGQAPPMVLVGIHAGTGKGNVGLWETTLPITIVGNPPGDSVNAGWQLDQLQAILGALGLAAWRPISWGDEQLPAIQLTYTRNVPNPNC